jgi:hypothetical protein
MEIEDVQRIIASLTVLKVWFEGSNGQSGALAKIGTLNSDLEAMLKKLNDIPDDHLSEYKEMLIDTVQSALVLKTDHLSMELDRAVKANTENLPFQVARVVIQALNKRDDSGAASRLARTESRNKDEQLRLLTQENINLKTSSRQGKSALIVMSGLSLLLALTILALVAKI